jgi:hypothetical protein
MRVAMCLRISSCPVPLEIKKKPFLEYVFLYKVIRTMDKVKNITYDRV